MVYDSNLLIEVRICRSGVGLNGNNNVSKVRHESNNTKDRKQMYSKSKLKRIHNGFQRSDGVTGKGQEEGIRRG